MNKKSKINDAMLYVQAKTPLFKFCCSENNQLLLGKMLRY